MAVANAVYVGNLNFDTDLPRLEEFLRQSGVQTRTGDVDLQTRSGDGKSRGWALVTFSSADEAEECIGALDGTSLDGRALRVNLDRPKRTNKPEYSSYSDPLSEQLAMTSLSTRVYVGNLPWSTGNDELLQMFEGYSPNQANIAFSHDNRSRGYGIVEFDTTEMATEAINGVNGTEVDGRSVTVRFDKGQSQGRRGNSDAPNASVFVRNLPPSMNWKGLKDLFSELAPEFADVKMNSDGGSRGWGTVRFASTEVATEAIKRFNCYEIDDRVLEVRVDSKGAR